MAGERKGTSDAVVAKAQSQFQFSVQRRCSSVTSGRHGRKSARREAQGVR